MPQLKDADTSQSHVISSPIDFKAPRVEIPSLKFTPERYAARKNLRPNSFLE